MTPILEPTFSDGMRRLAQIRQIPGYNRAVLQKYGSALPETVLDGELLRLQLARDELLEPDPVASALNALKNAYETRDVFNIRRWESDVEKLHARQNLDRVRVMARKDHPLGYTTAGFWDKRGLSDWDQALGQEPFSYTNVGGGWARVEVNGQDDYIPLWQARRKAARLSRPAPTYQQRFQAAGRAGRSEYDEFRKLAREGKLPPGVRNIRQLRSHRQQQARAAARRARRQRAAHDRADYRKDHALKQRERQAENRDKNRLRREEESRRQKGYTDDQLRQIRDSSSAPRWQRLMAQAKLGERAAGGPGSIKRYHSPRPRTATATYGGKRYVLAHGQAVQVGVVPGYQRSTPSARQAAAWQASRRGAGFYMPGTATSLSGSSLSGFG